ncbi:MAG: hypothetical protein WCG34_13040 [Leptolinea sp.]
MRNTLTFIIFITLVSLITILTACSPLAKTTPTTEPTSSGLQITEPVEATPSMVPLVTPNYSLTATAQAESMKKDLQKLLDSGLIQAVDGKYYRVQDLTGEWAKLGYYSWWPLDRKPTNFAIRANVKWDIANPSSNLAKAGCGFVFHEQGPDNLHFSFLSLDGYVRNIRMEKRVFTDLQANYAGKIKLPSDSVELMLVVENKWITFLVDNKVVIHIEDSHLAGGGLSMAVASGTNTGFGTRCQFQNVELWEFN